VNAVVPGLVRTGLHQKLSKSQKEAEDMFDGASKKHAVGFVATPEDIAEAYLYAVRADYATGTLIQIGGLLFLRSLKSAHEADGGPE
jgi:NAD(P)-dependent dehydrogenase (short-subunit alcohol dehydrogenase family)